MGLPAGPARFLKTHYLIAVFIAVILVAASLTGFAWADTSVTVIVDGVSKTLDTSASDVASLLEEAGIEVGAGDMVVPRLSEPLEAGDVVVVRHAMPVTLRLGDQVITLNVLGRTVADALVRAGLDPTGGMETEPAISEPLVPGTVIRAADAFLRTVQVEEKVDFAKVVKRDSGLPRGATRVIRRGVPGRALRIYHVLVVGGQPGPRTLRAQRVLVKARDEVVVVGTGGLWSPKPDDPGPVRRAVAAPPKVGKAFYVRSTAYTPWDAGCGGIGEIQYRFRVYDVPDGWGIVAVDPAVIPIGSRLHVSGYGYAVACDTGGAIQGRIIDVCYWGADLYAKAPSSADADGSVKRAARAASHHWGVRSRVKVIILSKP